MTASHATSARVSFAAAVLASEAVLPDQPILGDPGPFYTVTGSARMDGRLNVVGPFGPVEPVLPSS